MKELFTLKLLGLFSLFIICTCFYILANSFTPAPDPDETSAQNYNVSVTSVTTFNKALLSLDTKNLMCNDTSHNDKNGPSVITDKPDYKPAETAVINASGFEPGETIEFHVLHIDGKPNTGNGHEAWFVTDGGADDLDGKVDGKIKTTWYVDPDDSLNSLFELTANGESSGLKANTKFKDDVCIPTAISASYNAVTDILTVTIDWEWTNNDEKVVSAVIFADLNGDGETPGPTDDPSTWVASSSSGNGMGIDLTTPSDEFLGQLASSEIDGSTATGDNTDNGISSLALAYEGLDVNTPIVLFPYDLTPVDDVVPQTSPRTGTFTLTYDDVTIAPASICVVLYDIHTDGGTVEPSGTKIADVKDGEIDVNNDGSFDNDDDATNYMGTGYNIINGEVDISGNGSIGGEDDLTDNTFFGFDVFDGEVDINGDGNGNNADDGILGTGTAGSIDDFTGNHSVITSGPDPPKHNGDNSVEAGCCGGVVLCGATASTTSFPTCSVAGTTAVCQEVQNVYTATTDASSPAYSWAFSTNTSGASIVGASTNSTVTVNAGTEAGIYVIQVTITDGNSTSICGLEVTVSEKNKAAAIQVVKN